MEVTGKVVIFKSDAFCSHFDTYFARLKVKLLGLTVRHLGGSANMTLSTGVGSVCINIKEEGEQFARVCVRGIGMRPRLTSSVRC